MSERTEVQNPLIRYAAEIGWTYISQEEALTLRGGETGLFFTDILAGQLRKLNPRLTFDPQAVIRALENLRTGIEGNHDLLLYLRGQKSVYDPTQKRELNLTLVDFDHLENNLFHVTDEWEYTNGRYTNRADVVFLINGVPVALVETKGVNKKDGIEHGLTQVRRYHRETPEMVTPPQVWDVTHYHDFYYGVTWSLDRKNVFKWNDERGTMNDERNNSSLIIHRLKTPSKPSSTARASFACCAITSSSLAKTTSCASSSCASTRPAPSKRSSPAPSTRTNEPDSYGTRKALARPSP